MKFNKLLCIVTLGTSLTSCLPRGNSSADSSTVQGTGSRATSDNTGPEILLHCNKSSHDFMEHDYVTLAVLDVNQKKDGSVRGLLIFASKYNGVDTVDEVRIKSFPSSEIRVDYLNGVEAFRRVLLKGYERKQEPLAVKSRDNKDDAFTFSGNGCKIQEEVAQKL